ncbi:1,2-epoxyphenylacetyl-CoA isomerase [compost metagenome]
MQRVIGYSKAMQMSLTGDIVAGEEALRMGLLNTLVSDADLKTETEKLAAKIASNAPVAVQMTKKLMKVAAHSDLQTVLDMAAAFQGITQRTEDHFKALTAMKEKSTAEFQGK